MKILVLDDEEMILEEMEEILEEVAPDAQVKTFSNPRKALEYAKENPVEVVFLDIEMGMLNGLQVAKELKLSNPKVNLIFVTGFSQYAASAISLRASGYVMKPPTVANVREELENLRNPVAPERTDKLHIQCFGNFEVFENGEPLRFERKRTKELLAYLTDRKGAMVTIGEISSVLFENDENEASNKSYCRSLLADLRKTLQRCGKEEVLIRSFQNSYGLNTEKVTCDYYEFLKGTPEGIRAYNGEYMTQYAWGEVTLASLEK